MDLIKRWAVVLGKYLLDDKQPDGTTRTADVDLETWRVTVALMPPDVPDGYWDAIRSLVLNGPQRSVIVEALKACRTIAPGLVDEFLPVLAVRQALARVAGIGMSFHRQASASEQRGNQTQWGGQGGVSG